MKKISAQKRVYLIRKSQKLKYRYARKKRNKKYLITQYCKRNKELNISQQNKNKSINKTNRIKQKYDKVVKCPEIFSLIKNPEQVNKFIETLQRNHKKRVSTFVDMSEIIEITQDAIVVLLSIMYEFKRCKILFNGDFPKNRVCKGILRQSGFFENLLSSKDIRYNTKANTYVRKHGKFAQGEEAKHVIAISSNNIWNKKKRCPGVYRILIELMQNTHAHASLTHKGGENWWLSVNYDGSNNSVSFYFFDYGVGVFNSLENKDSSSLFFNIIPKLRSLVNSDDNAELLRLIMDGTMHKTCTGHYYRGKGLPGIKTTHDREQISDLFIITNNAFGDISNNKYVNLQNGLNGTFLSWKLTENNSNCYE